MNILMEAQNPICHILLFGSLTPNMWESRANGRSPYKTPIMQYIQRKQARIYLSISQEFGSEDAFGVFSKDRAGTDIKLGNGSALFNNYLYLWNDIYFIRIGAVEGDVLAEDVIYAGKSIINIMPYKKVSLPSILSLLPQQHLVRESPYSFIKRLFSTTYTYPTIISKRMCFI